VSRLHCSYSSSNPFYVHIAHCKEEPALLAERLQGFRPGLKPKSTAYYYMWAQAIQLLGLSQ